MLWDLATGRQLARRWSTKDGGWLIVTPEGYYDSSLTGGKYVCWRVGNEVYGVEQYEDQFHRPDLVAKSLRGEPLPAGIPTVSAEHVPPKVALAVIRDTESLLANQVEVEVAVTCGSPEDEIADVAVSVDGRALWQERAKSVVVYPREGRTERYRVSVPLPADKPQATISAVATTKAGLTSDPAIVVIRRAQVQEAPSRLWVFAVGVGAYPHFPPGMRLRFAAADVRDLANTFQRQSASTFAEVQVKVLSDAEATREAILAGISWLQQNSQPNDLVVFALSGHGVTDKQGGRYFAPVECSPDDIPGTALPWEEVARRLREVPCRAAIVLLDCCFAGAFGDVAGATTDNIARTLMKVGSAFVLASSKGTEESFEVAALGHGAFTAAVLRALGGEADMPVPQRDGVITVNELQLYVSGLVPQLTENRQHPIVPDLVGFDLQTPVARTG